MSTLRDKVVMITGASSGIGAALAREAARQGADVALLARREERLEALAREVEAAGRRALVLRADVTADGDLEAAAARTREAFGRVDVVVANAGFSVAHGFSRLTLEDYRRQLETNVFGVLRTAFATIEDLKASRGCLAVIGSVTGYVALPGTSPYAMSKAAVHALAESLHFELARHGVAVLKVVPGFVDSEIRQVDNRGVHHPDAREPIPGWLRMPADRAARLIIRAISRRRREVVITGHGRLIVALKRHFPRTLSFLVRRFGVRGRSAPEGSRPGSSS